MANPIRHWKIGMRCYLIGVVNLSCSTVASDVEDKHIKVHSKLLRRNKNFQRNTNFHKNIILIHRTRTFNTKIRFSGFGGLSSTSRILSGIKSVSS